MTPMRPISLRLPEETIRALEEEAFRLSGPGRPVSVAELVRRLLEQALDARADPGLGYG